MNHKRNPARLKNHTESPVKTHKAKQYTIKTDLKGRQAPRGKLIETLLRSPFARVRAVLVPTTPGAPELLASFTRVRATRVEMDALEDYHAVLTTLYSLLSPILYPTLRFLNWARTSSCPPRPLLLQLTNAAHDSPAIVSIGVLLVTLYISMRVVGFMQRMVAFGARLIFGLVFYGAIVVGGMMVYQRGVERTAND
ncbi:hypothetical protein VE04_06830, partial [Pseudogymnoascus sp. 24MN13]